MPIPPEVSRARGHRALARPVEVVAETVSLSPPDSHPLDRLDPSLFRTIMSPSFPRSGCGRLRNLWVVVALCACSADRACLGADGPVGCTACHPARSAELARSVHAALACGQCHGGSGSYTLSAGELDRFAGRTAGAAMTFDHGGGFRGAPRRADVPALCGDCHADVERMNPYGLPTDQLARYWTSGHGQTLRTKDDDRVAVCVDCHGSHEILRSHNPRSRTHPVNVPSTCARCHSDGALMGSYELPTAVVDEYRASVHGRLLLEQGDTGSPTCATCHGNHAAAPPGFASVRTVCGRCHEHAAASFGKSVHSTLEDFRGCVQCHGGGEDRHDHLIERITNPAGVMLQRYAHLLSQEAAPTSAQIARGIHAEPRQIVTRALPSCLECHEELEDDESLPKLFGILDDIVAAEQQYVATARRLNEVGRGVLPVDDQRFLFEDARTHLVELAPLQHTLSNAQVADKVTELTTVCDQVNEELDALEAGLRWRYRALIPIWGFAVFFSVLLYIKYRRLKHQYVAPRPEGGGG